jgi:hypothetical protein
LRPAQKHFRRAMRPTSARRSFPEVSHLTRVQARWQSTTFIPSGKFVLHLKFLRSGIRKDFFDKDEPVNDYTVTITNAGENYANPCQQYGGEGTDGISVGKWNTFRCTSALQDYFFSLKTNRFLVAYMVGYLDGRDDNSNTPSMSGGTCTKID